MKIVSWNVRMSPVRGDDLVTIVINRRYTLIEMATAEQAAQAMCDEFPEAEFDEVYCTIRKGLAVKNLGGIW